MKKLKSKIVVILMTIIMVIGAAPMAVQANSGVEILLNGKALVQNDEIGYAVIKDGRTMVPLRLVVEALGFTADWEMDGPNVITMRSGDKRVYHRVGTLEASDFSPLVQSAKVIATTDVPSYIASGRTMVGLRLISEAFGVGVEWKRNATGGGQVILTTDAPKDDLIWLDSSNSVSRSQIVNRLSQHQVLDSNSRFGIQKYRTIAEQAKDWEPTQDGKDMSQFIGRSVLVDRAKGYIHGIYNVDTQKMTAEQWINQYLGYMLNLKTVSREERNEWQQSRLSLWPSMQAQKLQMETVFVTDEELVYVLQEDEAFLNRAGEEKELTPWAVRGTMFYRASGQGDSNFWLTSGRYEKDEWYWVDIEIRFGVNENDAPNYLAVTSPSKTIWIEKDGSYMPWDKAHASRHLSTFK